jgi:integrase
MRPLSDGAPPPTCQHAAMRTCELSSAPVHRTRKRCSDSAARGLTPWQDAIEMLREVVVGRTFDSVAAAHAVSRSAVERRIKMVSAHVAKTLGIQGLNQDGAASARRLRVHREAVLAALDRLGPEEPISTRGIRILSPTEIAAGALRIRGRSQRSKEELALYYLLLATGARPLEIARLEVRDYLHPDGSVRAASTFRADIAITGRERPLLFTSAHLVDALDAYLSERVALGTGVGTAPDYRGLAPTSRLFLSANGVGFEIQPIGVGGQKRYSCRAIQRVYDRLFRYAEMADITALTARHTVADLLYSRGADEAQVGLLFGIAGHWAVRDLFPRPTRPLDQLTRDLV